MGKIVWKGSTLLAPVPPALVSCGTMENSNLLTVAWTGIVNTHPPMTYVSIRPERHSYGIIRESGEFVINLTPAALVRAVDFCGVRSGRDLNKWEACGLTPASSSSLAAPLVQECPLALECRVKQIISLGTHDMFLAEIVAIDIEEDLLDKAGKLNLEQAKLTAFAHGEYFEIGKCIGSFGFSVRKKPKIIRKHYPSKKKGQERK